MFSLYPRFFHSIAGVLLNITVVLSNITGFFVTQQVFSQHQVFSWYHNCFTALQVFGIIKSVAALQVFGIIRSVTEHERASIVPDRLVGVIVRVSLESGRSEVRIRLATGFFRVESYQ